MFRFLAVILCAVFLASGAFAAGGQGRDADDSILIIRRERMREFRQEMLRQREEGVPGPGWRGGRQDPPAEATPAEQRNLRRLTPEERQRLRRDLRDAYNQR